ncbi:MAG: CHAT domain-containing protein [Pseudanabaenaceae cyanobacterium bins.39]|nr:CHAT domain-containing protein [Pseudanabaenaceae cyanobacterium bins.39]
MRFKVRIVKAVLLFMVFVTTAFLQPLFAKSINYNLLPTAFQGNVDQSKEASKAVADLVNLDLFEQGKSLYKSGKFQEALLAWQQALTVYQQQNDQLSISATLSNISLAHQSLGQWDQAEIAISRGLQIAKSITPTTKRSQMQIAQALDTRASLAFALGQTESAIDFWQEAATLHRELKDTQSYIRNVINQEQALKSQGFYRRSQQILEDLLVQIAAEPDSIDKAIALNSYGEILAITGNTQLAKQQLDASLQMLKSLPVAANPEAIEQQSSILLNLGNVFRAEQDFSTARQLYEKSAQMSQQTANRIQSKLNLLSLEIEVANFDEARKLRSQLASEIGNLPVSMGSIRSRINFGQSLLNLTKLLPESEHIALKTDAAKIFAQAVNQSQSINDLYGLSLALGSLGNVYERNQQVAESVKLTERALAISQSLGAQDIAYRWQWQLGRLFKTSGDRQAAIAAYSESVKTLKQLRSDLAFINANVQFSFRESVEPVYRQLVSLLLDPTDEQIANPQKQKNLQQAQSVIESLQLAELVDFFRADCLRAAQVDINKLDRTAAVIYPILLEDRLEVIISLPNQPLRHYATVIAPQAIDDLVLDLRNDLRDVSSLDYLANAQKLYDIMIRPSAEELQKSQVQTLVFVLDGSLRNIPMAALHDGQRFLMEKYSIALTPGLQLVDPRPIAKQQISALTGGLTDAQQGFSALPSVTLELQEVKNQLPSTIVLLNSDFTKEKLEQELISTSVPIIHFATHGNFSSQLVNTFLLTYDGRLDIETLNQLLNIKSRSDTDPIELLILSACQTAVGDKRAALGMAGMAVRAGARSTIASLWAVDDVATSKLMVALYQNLANPNLTRANALKLAQQSLIDDPVYNHPYFWAPFVLLGNWL